MRIFIKMFIRGFFRNRSYTTVNLLGLSMGYAIFMLAVSCYYFETHFESFHTNQDRIYRATYRYAPEGGFETHWARIPFDYINELPNEISGVGHLIRFQNQERKYVRVGTEKFRPAHAYVTDPDVFKVFNFNLLQGDPDLALAQPNSIVLSQTLAHRYFGDENPIGKDLYVIGDLEQNETLHQVTGVMEDLAANTHLPVDMLISYQHPTERTGWAYTYIMLDKSVSIKQIESQIPNFIKSHSDENGVKNDHIEFQPLADIHLHANLAREIIPGSNVFYANMVGFVGLLILIIATINFINLNSAMALGRVKEIGMRKMMGAKPIHLIAYLLSESIGYHVIAFLIGLSAAYLVFPLLQEITTVQFLMNPLAALLLAAGAVLIGGLLSGIYPVVLLTMLKPLEIVRTSEAITFSKKETPFSLKRVMVTLQFCISILLLGSALIAYHQIQYLKNKNLGMTRESVIAIPGVPNKVTAGIAGFKNLLEGKSHILAVSACMEVPSREIRDSGPVLVEGGNSDPSLAPIIDIQVIDPGMPALLGLEFLAGKNIPEPVNTLFPEFNDQFSLPDYLISKPRHYLINETAMRTLGWQTPEEAIGQNVSWSMGGLVLAPGPITGVVKDFHQETLKNKVDPVVMVYEPVWLRTLLIKVSTDDLQSAVADVQAAWNQLFPFYPMEYHFLDELYENLYQGERVQLQLLILFSGLAIIIAFLGLLGLVTYALKTRVKELAIRKVLGANTKDLIQLMSREYVMIVAISSLVAIPVSVYGVRQWLSGFAYHIDISPISYALAIVLIMILLLGTIVSQTLIASRANPVDTLRNE